MGLHELDLYNHTIIGYEVRGGVFLLLHEIDLYHHTIIGYEVRGGLF